jgi:cysteine desulfurase/selenocysteine lyase
MNLTEILQNESRRRELFPVVAEKIFLAHAAVSPLPAPVADAMSRYVAEASRDNQEDVIGGQISKKTRALAAKLLGVSAEEIALVGPTSVGISLVAAGLPWQKGDNVVCYRDDYPANVYPWMNLAPRGVLTKFVEPQQFGNITVADLERIVDNNTRLVALPSAHFQSGGRLDLDSIGKFCRERNILFCVDAIQTLGALKFSAKFVDFAASGAPKWLLGPLGAGILFVRREHFERLRPPLVGAHNAECPNFLPMDELKFLRDARRYEPGSENVVGLVGLCASLELFLEIGMDLIEERVLSNAKFVMEGAQKRGWRVMGPTEGARMSGIVTLAHDKKDVREVYAKLMGKRIVTSLRILRDGRACVRFSPHFYNTEAELERARDEL